MRNKKSNVKQMNVNVSLDIFKKFTGMVKVLRACFLLKLIISLIGFHLFDVADIICSSLKQHINSLVAYLLSVFESVNRLCGLVVGGLY